MMNEKAISGLYHSTKAARVILNELAALPRQNETRLDVIEKRLEGNREVPRRYIVTFFKQLEEFGAGEFIPGRRGHPSRFKWTADSVNISTLDVSYPVPEEESFIAPTRTLTIIPHKFQLRKDLVVTLSLPTDLNASEADRLAQFIKTLPF